MEYLKTLDEINNLIDENQMTLIYFGSEDCGVCVSLKPKIKNLLKEYPHIAMGQVDVKEDFQLGATFSIFTIPAVLLYVNGRETLREARHISMMDLEYRINRYYGMLYE